MEFNRQKKEDSLGTAMKVEDILKLEYRLKVEGDTKSGEVDFYYTNVNLTKVYTNPIINCYHVKTGTDKDTIVYCRPVNIKQFAYSIYYELTPEDVTPDNHIGSTTI